MSPREIELERVVRWALAETRPLTVSMGPLGSDPFPVRVPDWAEEARDILAGQEARCSIAEACEVLEGTRARAGTDLLDLLARMRDSPGLYAPRERAAFRVFMREGARMFAPAE